MTGLDPGDLLWLSLLGGWVALDGTSFGQFMISRPLVAASLAGWIAGDATAGAGIGVVLEAFHLGILPIGAARHPESGPAAIVAGATFATSSHSSSALLLTLVIALLLERVGGESMHQMRQLNVHIAGTRSFLRPEQLEWRHLAAAGLDFLRGIVLVLIGLSVSTSLLALLLPIWGLDERLTGLIVSGALVALVASSFRLLGARKAWFACGVAVGIGFVLAT